MAGHLFSALLGGGGMDIASWKINGERNRKIAKNMKNPKIIFHQRSMFFRPGPWKCQEGTENDLIFGKLNIAVDGSEIRRSPVEVGSLSTIIFNRVLRYIPGGCLGFLLSTVAVAGEYPAIWKIGKRSSKGPFSSYVRLLECYITGWKKSCLSIQ